MAIENNRLLLSLEKDMRDINRAVINPEFSSLSLQDLRPLLQLVARARLDYLKEAFTIAKEFPDSLPGADRVQSLREHRLRYEELVHASRALETAIDRMYLDVADTSG